MADDFPQEWLDKIDKAVEEVHDDLIEWRHHIHQNPELSNREEKTAKYIADLLEDFGYDDVVTGLGGHGVATVLHGGGSPEGKRRSIVLRADIDALPVPDKSGVEFASEVVDKDYPGGPFPVTHACGHDAHAAMLLAAAKVLADLKEDVPGDVVFAFQPAEEGPPVDEPGGAREMVKEAFFDELDPEPTMAFGMHVGGGPKGWVMYSQGVQNGSSELLSIKITGEQVHGSSPWQGKDPMPPAAEIITAMGQLYRQIDAQKDFTITIGHIQDEGRFNVVGNSVTLLGTVRCLQEGVEAQINERIERTAKHIAAAYDCEAEVEFIQQVPPVVNRPEWVEKILPSFHRSTRGDAKVIEVPASLGYDDVSEFINRWGGIYGLLGVQDVEVDEDGNLKETEGGRGFVANHSPKFYVDDEAMVTGVRMHVNVALDHLRGTLVPDDK